MQKEGDRRPRRGFRAACRCGAALLGLVGAVAAQGEDPPLQPQDPTLRELLRRNAELEQRVERLESRQLEQEEALAAVPEPGLDDEDFGLVFRYGDAVIQFQLFGDVGYTYFNPEFDNTGNNTFDLGVVDFFVNAQLGEHVRVLSETVFTTSSAGATSVTQMRLWGMYEFGDHLYVKLGTEHSRISRWNQMFHHGRYLELSIRRPFLARFERVGGILPVHSTGLEVGGSVFPEVGQIEYWGAITNGRGATVTDRNTTLDPNNGKRLDAGLALVPAGMSDLRIGASITYDDIPDDPASLDPLRALSIREIIATGHVQWNVDAFELLGEFAWIGHETRVSGADSDSHSGYLQVAYHCGEWTPYTRFDYRNMAEGDPFYGSANRDLDSWEQILGVRRELGRNLALKLEVGVGRDEQRSSPANISERSTIIAGVQLSWTL